MNTSIVSLSLGKRVLYMGSLYASFFAAMFSIAGASLYIAAALGQMDGMPFMGLTFSVESLSRCAVIPAAAVLGNKYLRKRVYIVGLGVFAAGTLLCFSATSLIAIMVARALMGVGWGLFYANSIVMINDLYPPEKAPAFMGVLQTIGLAACLIALPVAGLMIDFADWRFAAIIAFPLSLIALAAMAFCPVVQKGAKTARAIDAKGIALTILSALPFSLALAFDGNIFDWTHPVIIGMLVFAAVMVVALAFVERKASNPVFPVKLLGNKDYMLVVAMAVLFAAGFSSTSNFYPSIFQTYLGLTATESSIPTTVASVICALMASAIGAWYSKTGNAKPLFLAEGIVLTLLSIGFFFMPSTAGMIIPAMLLAILGFPQAIHQVVPNSYPGQTMPEQDVATAVGFVSFSQICVTSAFTSIVGALFNMDIMLPLKIILFPSILMIIVALSMNRTKRIS